MTKLLIPAIFLCALIAACGGGEVAEPSEASVTVQSSTASAAQQAETPSSRASIAAISEPVFTVSGVAFAGGPLLALTVDVKDAQGRTWSVQSTSQGGQWSIQLPASTNLPLLVRATGYLAGKKTALYSRLLGGVPTAGSFEYVSVNPFTDTLTRRAYANPGADYLMADLQAPLPVIDQARANFDAQVLRRLSENHLRQLGLPLNLDFYRQFGNATGSGFSALLERISPRYDVVLGKMVLQPLIGAEYVVPIEGVSSPLAAHEYSVPEISGNLFARLDKLSKTLQRLPYITPQEKLSFARFAFHENFIHDDTEWQFHVLTSEQWADRSLSNVAIKVKACEPSNRVASVGSSPALTVSGGRVCEVRLGWSRASSAGLVWESMETKLFFSTWDLGAQAKIIGNRKCEATI